MTQEPKKKKASPASEPTKPSPSRYEKVKAILDAASIGSSATYQGYDRFWNLPIAELLVLELYGVGMIAPENFAASAEQSSPVAAPTGCPHLAPPTVKESSCCHASPETVAVKNSASVPGRGAASGLIIGLKGQFPFDGTQFPPLPWGGTRVADSDIEFISQWIDDGCPESDAHSAAKHVHGQQLLALANGTALHASYVGSTNDFHQEAGTLKARKNINYLTADELSRFRAALAQMKSLDQYFQDDRSFAYWARIHATSCQHGWEEFLTWHRAYLYFFEKQLQDIDPSVTLPYWDWAEDRFNQEKAIADMGSKVPLDNGIIPEAYRCWMDQSGLDALRKGGLVPADVLAKLEKILNQTFCSGNRLFLAAGIEFGKNRGSDQAILNQLALINPLWHPQRWPGGDSSIIFETYPTPEDVSRILQLDNFFSFGSGPTDDHFFGALEQIHNLMHNFTGGENPNYSTSLPASRNNVQYGDMVNAGVTAFDPIFWAHHSNVDRLWAEWQKLHPGVGPDNPTAVLPPWRTTVSQTYSTAALGYEYMKAATLFPTDNSLPIKRFHSAPAGVHPKVASQHKRAEIRLHSVQYPARVGYHIRVYLNQPDANEKTPTKGNPHYVGMLHLFSGTCIGGPGHCDVPPAPLCESNGRPRFDHRGRAHKAPVNFRLDATSAVKALVAKGAKDFQVHLVVLNTNGSAASDALILDAVSLNFLD